MKKPNQQKKQSDTNSSKGLKLPLIQSNVKNGNTKKSQEQPSKNKEDLKIPNIPLTKSFPKGRKSFELNKKSQNSNEASGKSETKTNKTSYKALKTEGAEDSKQKISNEKLMQLKEQRKQRLKQQRIEEEKQYKLYEKLIEEYKTNPKDKPKTDESKNIEENPQVIISSKKAQRILEEGGMLDAYKHVLAQLCKNGLPAGDIFEYASYVVKNYEKKWKEKKSQMMKDKIDKYYKEKEIEIDEAKKNSGEIIINKSLENRDTLKFIQSLDKSRSGRNVVPKPDPSKNKNKQNTNKKDLKDTKENKIDSKKSKENSAEKNNTIKNNNNSNSSNRGNSNSKNNKSKEKKDGENNKNKNNKKGK